MSKKNAESFLIAGGENHGIRAKYDAIKTKEDFVAAANGDGYDFTLGEFDEVLRESGDSFDLIGNPAKRQIWWV
ncbi:MAG: bacteriocin [Desulfobulbaceae bacterium DB1]|nr:MAG: bacteriocin [Desulfobulbaceae bacterium DB1]